MVEAVEVDADRGVAAEAVLDRGVWTLIVAAERFAEATALAREERYGLPIARAGTGTPGGALAALSGLPAAGGYLAEIDLPLSEDGQPGVASDGLVRGRSWASFRAPDRPTLGARARRDALVRSQARLTELDHLLPQLREAATEARTRAMTVAMAVASVAHLSELSQAYERAAASPSRQREQVEEIAGRVRDRAGGGRHHHRLATRDRTGVTTGPLRSRRHDT